MRARWWTYIIPPHIYLLQAEEAVAFGTGLHDLFQDQVHPCVAADEMAIECFAVLELDKHGMALGCGEKAEGELFWEGTVSGRRV